MAAPTTTAAHAAATKAARGKRPPPNSRRRSRCSRSRPGGSPNSCHAWTTASRGWPTPKTGSAGRWRRSSNASATPSRGVIRWTAQARRAVSPAARRAFVRRAKLARRHHPPPRGRPHRKARAAQVKEAATEAATAKRPRRGMHSPPMPASKPPCVAPARSWPTAPAGDGRTQCDSMGCSTRPGRVPPVGSGLPARRQPASLPSCHRPGRTGPGPVAARPGREGYPGRFRLMVETPSPMGPSGGSPAFRLRGGPGRRRRPGSRPARPFLTPADGTLGSHWSHSSQTSIRAAIASSRRSSTCCPLMPCAPLTNSPPRWGAPRCPCGPRAPAPILRDLTDNGKEPPN